MGAEKGRRGVWFISVWPASLLRAPWWDELECDPDASVRYDAATDSYVYSFKIEMENLPATLTIPVKFFTPDMDSAPNRTRQDRPPPIANR